MRGDMNEKEKSYFLMQYVLNRALGARDGLDGDGAAKEALKAWNEIVKGVKDGIN